MKVVLSRKGFDSSYGGCPSPILPDGTLLSMPIPELRYLKDPETKEETWDNKQYQPLTYSDLSLPKSVKEYFEEKELSIETYQNVLDELLPKDTLIGNKVPYTKDLRWTCHFDPDLIPSVLKRPPEWRSLFGQGGRAEGHLRNQNVGANDVFLFFGWFRRTVILKGKLVFDPKNNPNLHLIHGYMQVEHKITHKENREKVKAWMNYHSHLRLEAWNNEKNAIYLGRKTLSWNVEKPGVGTFHYHPSLELTDTTEQNNPNKNRTRWRAELFPEDLKMTYHPKNHRTEYDEQGNKRKYFRVNDIGQEFIITKPAKMTDWMKSIIEANETVS